MVRLKVQCGEIHGVWPIGFNSIVVRLKDGSGSHKVAIDRRFQFHSGSIKSRCRAGNGAPDIEFQFHSGSIKRFNARHGGVGLFEFQFHSGSIKRSHYLLHHPKRR